MFYVIDDTKIEHKSVQMDRINDEWGRQDLGKNIILCSDQLYE